MLCDLKQMLNTGGKTTIWKNRFQQMQKYCNES